MKFEFSKLSGRLAALQLSVQTEVPSNAKKSSEERQLKRLAEMQAAVKRLQAMPSQKAVAKQATTNKVGMLKQRLDALKALLLHASPAQAKALLQELKSIAKELSAAAKSLGGGSGGGAATAAESSAPEAGASAESAESAEESGSAASSEVAGGEAAPSNSPEPSANGGAALDATSGSNTNADGTTRISDAASSEVNGQAAAQDGDDQALRALLIDARKSLKEAVALLKSKLTHPDKETRHDLQAIDKSLSEIDKALGQGGNDFYTGLGNLSVSGTESGLSISVSVSGLNVNLSA